eukprot:Seg2834.1 transcript_id=Seg2834.1/GoldUCD/mRNA.D3Y31 product="hypothetical protein" protein_id=Seg2834.1/GoldUCD/D3Y31
MDIRMLPLAYHTNHTPSSESICDWPGCCKDTSEQIVLFDGCWHFFHVSCMPSVCIICQSYLKDQLNSLSPVMQRGLFPSEEELADDEADGEVIQQQQEDSTQVVPVIVNEEEVMEKLEAIKMKVSSLTEKSKKLKDCSIAQQKIRHCKTCTHSLTFHSGKKETKNLCQVCPDGYCDAKGKKEQCICENHKSPKLAAMDFKITSPSSNIFHVMIHPQQNAKCKAGFENVSGIISGILSEAFLRGNLNSLSISGLVEKYITIIQDAHDLAKIRIQLHQESSSDLLRGTLPADVVSDEEFHITSLHTFKQMVDRSLQSSEMKAIILQIPSTKNIKFLGIRDGFIYLMSYDSSQKEPAYVILGVQSSGREFAVHFDSLLRKSSKHPFQDMTAHTVKLSK